MFELTHGISKKYNATITQVALNWLLESNPRVIPIPGEKNSRQAAANAATISWKLTREEFNKLSQTERATSLPR
ncbi:aldo/keto reductase [Paenibacillus albidus]|nr:aldo/keto reductase [Paenibacillus albidus]